MQVDAITMEMKLLVLVCRFAEGVNFHWVCNGGRDKESRRVRVVELLGVHSRGVILIQLLCPACCLVYNEFSSGTHKTDGSIWWLKFGHVTGVIGLL